jgi:predicted nucleic acid-binding Zn finger protein
VAASFWQELESSGELTPRLKDEMLKIWGDRGEKALEGLKNGKVTKYLDFFVVDGRRPYVVEEELCTCDDYIFRGSRTGDPCWHLIAVKIARITGQYEKVEKWFHEIGL